MRSKVSIAGHPIHPMLVTLPIGLFVWTLVSDIVYIFTDDNRLWYDMAFWTSIAAIATALAAAIPGFVDYLTMPLTGKVRAAATAHMLLNLTVVALFFGAMLLMLNDNALTGTPLLIVVILHAVGVGLLAVSGWLGGEMVYRFRLAVMEVPGEVREHEGH